MKINIIICGFIFCFLLTACNTKLTVNNENVSNFIQDENAKEKWNQNTSDKQKEILNDLAKSEQLVSTRKKVILEDTKRDTIPDPVMPNEMVAGVEIRLGKKVSSYNSTFKIESISENKISGLLDDESFANIFYKLPNKESLQRGREQEYFLDYNEVLVSGSLNKTILVKDKRSPFLLLLEEGSNKPYARTLKSIDLTVTQWAGEQEDYSSVRINFQNQTFNLSLGERKKVKSLSGEVEFFLKGAYQSNNSLLEEGLPYFVKLFVYRVD